MSWLDFRGAGGQDKGHKASSGSPDLQAVKNSQCHTQCVALKIFGWEKIFSWVLNLPRVRMWYKTISSEN